MSLPSKTNLCHIIVCWNPDWDHGPKNQRMLSNWCSHLNVYSAIGFCICDEVVDPDVNCNSIQFKIIQLLYIHIILYDIHRFCLSMRFISMYSFWMKFSQHLCFFFLLGSSKKSPKNDLARWECGPLPKLLRKAWVWKKSIPWPTLIDGSSRNFMDFICSRAPWGG